MSSAIGTLSQGALAAGPAALAGIAGGRARAEDYRFRTEQSRLRHEALRQQNMLQIKRLLVDLENARRRGKQEDLDRKAKRVSELTDIILKDPGAFSAMPEESQERVLLEFAELQGYTPYGTLVPKGKRRETVPREGIHAAMRPTEATMNRIVDDPSAPARVLDIPKIALDPSEQALVDWRKAQGQNLTFMQGFRNRQLEELTAYHKGLLENAARTNDIREIENNWKKDIAYQLATIQYFRTEAYRELTYAQAAKVRDDLIRNVGTLPQALQDRIEVLSKIGLKHETLPSGRVRFSRDPIAVRAREELAEILGLNAAAMVEAAVGGGAAPQSPFGPGTSLVPGTGLGARGSGLGARGSGLGGPPVLPPAGAAGAAPGGGTRITPPLGAPTLTPPALPAPAAPPPIPGGGAALGPGWQPRSAPPPRAPAGRVPAPKGPKPKAPPGPNAPSSLKQKDIDYVQRMIDDGLYEAVAQANPPTTEGGKRLRAIYRIITGRKSPR